ncbi:predicted protein [Histoplasma capsulatum var. duboisii H88]|uniref:Predicted protein n=2 Tax=Ajellomyces capsulatus TaxID=5037 RepID=F0USR3_AJEC8|nr:predicted protein [Histoplasma capsulatum H143]EGC48940.1 predicted protein [Histoplasma capsulatum var. duboisii H88]
MWAYQGSILRARNVASPSPFSDMGLYLTNALHKVTNQDSEVYYHSHVTGLSTAYHLLRIPKGLPLSSKKVQRPTKISIDLGPDENGGQSHATSNEYRRLKFLSKPPLHPAPEFMTG